MRRSHGRRVSSLGASCFLCPQAAAGCGQIALADDAAAEADGDRMGARARLELREEVPDVGLDRLLRKEQPLADLAVHEAVGDELEHLDLAHRRLLLELAKRALERDHLRRRCRCRRREATSSKRREWSA